MIMHASGKAAAGTKKSTAKPSAPVPGAGPTHPYDPALAVQLYTPKAKAAVRGVTPELVGTGGFPYTVNRLYPVPGTFRQFPYALVGQLFFTIPDVGDFVCSASVIRRAVIATAGHCVSDGNGNFFTNWVFVPALSFGKAPYGKWNWNQVVVTNNWHFGGGGVPNIQDDALIVLNNKTLKGVTGPIGDFVGFFGFEFNADPNTHITQLGYPCNLDGCSTPIANSAQILAIDTNNFEWGSAEAGGASGGPEVQDFGVAPVGTPHEIKGGNIIISVLSFGFVDPAIQVDGGSIFGRPRQFAGGTMGDLINFVCRTPGNC